MKKHVLVMALSDFLPMMEQENTCEYKDISRKGEAPWSVTYHYQMEPVPLFLTRHLKHDITDIVLIGTKRTNEDRQNAPVRPDGQKKAWTGTVLDWYKEWIRVHLGNVETHDIRIEETNLPAALEDVLAKIRELYRQAGDPNDWQLWFDTHGGFRDISMVVVSAIRMLAVDEKKPVKTDGIISLFYNPQKHFGQIINQTAFYFVESAEALKNFLNYGQYLAVQFQPYEGNEPYAFISYRHDPDFLTAVRTAFCKFQEKGIRYWFDEGIPYQMKWSKVLQEKNREAEAFIVLLTKSYFESPECWKELIYATSRTKNGQKGIHFFYLESGVQAPEGIPNDSKYDEAKALQKELGVSDEELKNVLTFSKEKQWIQWFNLLSGQQGINRRNLFDQEVNENLVKISREISSETETASQGTKQKNSP